MTASTPAERRLIGKLGAHASWAVTEDRTARTAPARAALAARFLAEANGDPVRAEHLRKAHFLRLAHKSAQARRKIKTLTAEAAAAEAELQQAGGGSSAT
jgi:hypothetical protein